MFKRKLKLFTSVLTDVAFLLLIAATVAIFVPRHLGNSIIFFEFPELEKVYLKISASEASTLVHYLESATPEADGTARLVNDADKVERLKTLVNQMTTPLNGELQDQMVIAKASIRAVRFSIYFIGSLLFLLIAWQYITPKLLREKLERAFAEFQAKPILLGLGLDSTGKDNPAVFEKLCFLLWHVQEAKKIQEAILDSRGLFKDSDTKPFFYEISRLFTLLTRYFKSSQIKAIDPGSPALKKLSSKTEELKKREQRLEKWQAEIPQRIETGVATILEKLDLENRQSASTARAELLALEKAREERNRDKKELTELQAEVTEKTSRAQEAEASATQQLRAAERLHAEALEAKTAAEQALRAKEAIVLRIDAGCEYLSRQSGINPNTLLDLLQERKA